MGDIKAFPAVAINDIEPNAAPYLPRKRKAPPRPAPARHRWVRPWLIAQGDTLRQLAADTRVTIDQFEATHHPRLRVRRPADRISHEALVHAIVVNLAHSSLSPPPTGRLAILAGNPAKGAGRYDNAAFGKGVRPLIDQMHEMGLLDFRLPVAMRGEVSSIAPSPEFALKGPGARHHARRLRHTMSGEEFLALTRNVGTRAAKITDRVNYKETAETGAMRDAVRRVNAFLTKVGTLSSLRTASRRTRTRIRGS